jgi:glycosyltransferase involved in cell wall biosynthesis
MTDRNGTSRKIALLLPNLDGGGAERVTLRLAAELTRRGHRIDLVVAHHGGELLELLPPGVRIIELGAKRIRGSIGPLVSYLRRERPEALQASLWPYTLVAVIARAVARTSTRVMVVDHSTLSEQYPGKSLSSQMVRWTIRLLYPQADSRVIVSEGSADDIARFSGLPRRMWNVIYNPVDLPESLSVDSDGEQFWQGAKEKLITVGRLTSEKNHAMLIQAFALLARKRPKSALLILGRGELEPQLKALRSQLDLDRQVIFAGFVLDPWPHLQAADLFVLSSDFEGFGVVLVEALHAGLRIVSTDCPNGPREILDGGRFGTLVPKRNPEALAHAMDELLDQSVDRASHRKRARVLSGAQQVDLYEQLL